MERLVINGGKKLRGKLRVFSAKNSILPILAASILCNNNQGIIIEEVPKFNDVEVMLKILTSLGISLKQEGKKLYLNSTSIDSVAIPDNLMREMRSSIFLMGPLVARCGRVQVSHPGGCAIGPRPIDLHLKGLTALGVQIEEKHGFIYGKTEGKLKGAEIHLDYPSVGATENLMMASTLAEGRTVIFNAAKEPEIIDLQNFLNQMGACVKGAGTEIIRVEGVDELHGSTYRVIPDRIATGTFMMAAAITGGEVLLENVIPEHLEAVTAKLREANVDVVEEGDTLLIKKSGLLRAVHTVRTLPYPGFPTDLQAPIMSLLSVAQGTSIIIENVFEGRFKHVGELSRMNAKITIEGRTAIVNGVKGLTGAVVEASDLRAGAALVLAGLAACGRTYIYGLHHIDRGYEEIDKCLRNLGADIWREYDEVDANKLRSSI